MLQKLKEKLNQLLTFLRSERTPLYQRWPLLFWFGTIFCFVIFPVFLLDVGLDSFLATRKEMQKKEIFNRLNNRLELLLQYGNSRHFYHALLKKLCEMAEKSNDPIAYLKKAIPHLKSRNPNTFRFIVWNKNGKTVPQITDEKRYKYIVKTLYEVFVKATEECTINYPGNPAQIELVEKRINLLRSYLGAFFIPERLNLPFLKGILGECIMASSAPEKSHFWYRTQENFGLFANIHIDAIESNNYLKKLVNSLNRNDYNGVKCGTAELIKDRRVFTDARLKHKRELLVELGKFANSSESQLETDNLLLVVKPVTPFVLGFCTIPKQNVLIDIASARKNILIGAIAIISLLGLIIGYFIFKSGFFSIRWKLALLFIYANGLPLMILGFLGFEYLQQTRMQLLDQAQKQIEDLFSDMDSKFGILLDQQEKRANQACEALNKKFETGEPDARDFAEFEKQMLKLSPLDFILADENGDFKIFNCTGKKADKFISNMAKNLIKFANENYFTSFKIFDSNSERTDGKIKAQKLMSDDSIVFDEILQKVSKIIVQQMAAEERFYYWDYLGNIGARNFRYLLMLSWPLDRLQEIYLKQFLDGYNNNQHGIKFYAMVETNGLTYPESIIAPEVDKLFQQVFNLKVVRSDRVKVADERYTAFGSLGRQMSKVAVIGLYPIDSIERHVAAIKFRLIIFAMLSLALTSGIGIMLARQFLEPIKELENGVKAIGEQNFRYRIPTAGADEFGHLGNVFNRAIESLEDLEVAKIVQENLFPLEPLHHKGIEVFGKSVSMTRLGGDYYDYYSVDDDTVGVLMGDVAGHGVPAALLMAMAKASVLLAEEGEKQSPALLLSKLHNVIYRVKSKKIKRMMTCQYFSINGKTGQFKFSNAGHCFPALIRNSGKSIELLKHIGTPLGITKKARYKDEELCFSEGDILLLYTDGIVETKNDQGRELGFDNFQKIVQQCYDPVLETYYQKIFAAYLDWAQKAEDDITMVLIKFSSRQEQVIS
ncbi:MAG: phosphoserine phosphatase RsbU/P [Clostridiales bacterium]|nr:phosphoserine phosphatase RsbU/P [Clostridiales bacterium]MDN5281115.1 phosphoserine phosphatase RsbU/P [Candidatus Ozemobacter sp.]